MSTPQPNASTPPTVSAPPVIPLPTTPLGAVQTMMSLLSPPVASQGAPSPHPAPASHPEISPDAPVPTSVPPASATAPTPATYIAANPTFPAPASVSSHGGRAPTPPRETARTTRYSYPTLPEPSHPPPARPIPLPGVNCFRRMTPHYTDSETIRQTRDDRVHVRSLVPLMFPRGWLTLLLIVPPPSTSTPTVRSAHDWSRRSILPRQRAKKPHGQVRTRDEFYYCTQREYLLLTIYLCASYSTKNGVASQLRHRHPSSHRRAHYSLGCYIEW